MNATRSHEGLFIVFRYMQNTRETARLELNKLKDEELLTVSLSVPSAFGIIVDRYQNAFLRNAVGVVRRQEDAEDVVQDTFTKIYLGAKKFEKVEGASFKSWAYKILMNTASNHYRKLKKNLERFEYIGDNLNNSLTDDSILPLGKQIDLKGAVLKVLNYLPRHLRVVLSKYYIDDKPQKIIAKEEGVSLNTIKMRLFRARKMFKKITNEDKKLSWMI